MYNRDFLDKHGACRSVRFCLISAPGAWPYDAYLCFRRRTLLIRNCTRWATGEARGRFMCPYTFRITAVQGGTCVRVYMCVFPPVHQRCHSPGLWSYLYLQGQHSISISGLGGWKGRDSSLGQPAWYGSHTALGLGEIV